MKDERGFALVMTLLVTALLVALAVEFAAEVFVETSARQNFVDGQRASFLAESGVTGGIKALQHAQTQHPTFSSYLDPWAKPLIFDDETGHVTVNIEEESGKLNLNQIFGSNGAVLSPFNQAVATRLLKKLELPLELLDALVDWVDAGTVPPHPAGGKNGYYQSLKPPYEAKNARFDTIGELALVRGFSAPLVQKLRPYVTIYSDTPGSININTAPQEIIAALDDRMTDSLVNRVMEYRKTTPFQSPGDLGKVAGMETIFPGLTGFTTARGTVYRIVSQATVGETVRVIEAVLRIDGSQPTVLYWREF